MVPIGNHLARAARLWRAAGNLVVCSLPSPLCELATVLLSPVLLRYSLASSDIMVFLHREKLALRNFLGKFGDAEGKAPPAPARSQVLAATPGMLVSSGLRSIPAWAW